jgi:hypothetical protein
MRITGVTYDYPFIDVGEGEVSQPREHVFFNCDSCQEAYVSYAGEKVQKLRAPRKTKEQRELEAKKEAQKAKMRAMYEERQKEKAAAKEKERKELLALINKNVEETESVRVTGPSAPKKEKQAKKKGKLTDEEKKARSREYCRQRYLRLKAQK